MNYERPVRGRPVQSRLLYVCIGFLLGAILSTVIQNVSDAHLELYHRAQEDIDASISSESTLSQSATACNLPNHCGKLNYGAEDPITAAVALNPDGLIAWHYKDLRMDLSSNGTATNYIVSEHCMHSLNDGEAPHMGNATSALVTATEATTNPKVLKKACKTIDDNVLIISDTLGRASKNIFDELSTVWYHVWLLKRSVVGGGPCGNGHTWKITHLNDILNDQPPRYPQRWEHLKHVGSGGGSDASSSSKNANPTSSSSSIENLPFPEVMGLLGQYIPWTELTQGLHNKCIRFRRAVTTQSSWLWLGKPVPAHPNPPLQDLVDAIMQEYGIGGPRPLTRKCGFTLVYATRGGAASRRVINEQQLLETMKSTLHDFTIKNVDLGELEFSEQLAVVHSADVYVFPHGGAGPHVLWLPRGGVVLELFPYGDADPMYRNMAVQTGKTYFSWQASEFSTPFDWKGIGPRKSKDIYHFTNASDFEVDMDEVKPLLRTAAATVRNNLGLNWAPSHGTTAYSTFLCTMCTSRTEDGDACSSSSNGDKGSGGGKD